VASVAKCWRQKRFRGELYCPSSSCIVLASKHYDVRESEAAEDDGEDESEQEDEHSERNEQPPQPPVTGPLVSRQRRVAAL